MVCACAVQLKCRCNSSLDHTWVEAQEQLTLGDLLEQVSSKDYLELHVGVKTGKDEHSPTLKIFS